MAKETKNEVELLVVASVAAVVGPVGPPVGAVTVGPVGVAGLAVVGVAGLAVVGVAGAAVEGVVWAEATANTTAKMHSCLIAILMLEGRGQTDRVCFQVTVFIKNLILSLSFFSKHSA